MLALHAPPAAAARCAPSGGARQHLRPDCRRARARALARPRSCARPRRLHPHCAYKCAPRACPRSSSHDWRTCPYAHQGENAARRDHAVVQYLSVCCPESKAVRGALGQRRSGVACIEGAPGCGGGRAACGRGASWAHPQPLCGDAPLQSGLHQLQLSVLGRHPLCLYSCLDGSEQVLGTPAVPLLGGAQGRPLCGCWCGGSCWLGRPRPLKQPMSLPP